MFASEDLADSASIADQLPQAPKSKPNAKFGTIDGEIDLVSHLKGKGVVEVEVESVVENSSNLLLIVAIVCSCC